MRDSCSSRVYAALLPHAPVLIPNVAGRRIAEIADTVRAMREVAANVVRFAPSVVILVSPHSPRFSNAFAIWDAPRVTGSLAGFGHPEDGIDLPVARAAVERVSHLAEQYGLMAKPLRTTPLDHGAVVPLLFLAEAGWIGPTVVMGLPDEANGDAILGHVLCQVAEESRERLALIASGDMSHRLTEDAPCGFHPSGSRFDAEFIRLLKAGDCAGLRLLDPRLVESAAEDASDSTLIAFGATGFDTSGHRVLSYQGPFGVGYGVAILHEPLPAAAEASKTVSGRTAAVGEPGFEDLPRFARLAVAANLGCIASPDWPVPRTGPLSARRPVFVTLHTRDGQLRGCVGALSPQETDLIRETRHFALSAAFDDRRFPPVSARELDTLHFSVTVLGDLEDVFSPKEQLDPSVFGVSIQTPDGRRAVLLPQIEGITTVEEQLRIVRRKGGIDPEEAVSIKRFRADKFEESEQDRTVEKRA